MIDRSSRLAHPLCSGDAGGLHVRGTAPDQVGHAVHEVTALAAFPGLDHDHLRGAALVAKLFEPIALPGSHPLFLSARIRSSRGFDHRRARLMLEQHPPPFTWLPARYPEPDAVKPLVWALSPAFRPTPAARQ